MSIRDCNCVVSSKCFDMFSSLEDIFRFTASGIISTFGSYFLSKVYLLWSAVRCSLSTWISCALWSIYLDQFIPTLFSGESNFRIRGCWNFKVPISPGRHCHRSKPIWDMLCGHHYLVMSTSLSRRIWK